MSSSLDKAARKQVLLTRIAFERSQMRGDVAQLKESSQFSNLLRGFFSGNKWTRSLFGSGRSRSSGSSRNRGRSRSGPQEGWLPAAMTLFSRYRTAATVVAALTPILGSWAGIGRLLKWGGLATAGFVGWRTLTKPDKVARTPPRL